VTSPTTARGYGEGLASQEAVERLDPVLTFLRSLWEVDHALARASRDMQRRLGMTAPQFLALRVIEHVPGISAGELAKVMHLHPSSLTGVLRRLERRALIRRRPHPLDSRRAVLTLTGRGRRLARISPGTVEARTRRALEGLAPRRLAAAREVLGLLARSLLLGEARRPGRAA